MFLIKTITATLLLVIIAFACISILCYAKLQIKRFEKHIRNSSRPCFLFLTVFVICMIIYGGSKPVMYFANGLQDNGSYATNDTVYIAWTKTGSAVVPNDAELYIEYRIQGSTNESDWVEIWTGIVSDWSATFILDNATNYNYSIYYNYIPPPPVHTNGIWAYRTIRRPELDGHIIPMKAIVAGDTNTISPKKIIKEQ